MITNILFKQTIYIVTFKKLKQLHMKRVFNMLTIIMFSHYHISPVVITTRTYCI